MPLLQVRVDVVRDEQMLLVVLTRKAPELEVSVGSDVNLFWQLVKWAKFELYHWTRSLLFAVNPFDFARIALLDYI